MFVPHAIFMVYEWISEVPAEAAIKYSTTFGSDTEKKKSVCSYIIMSETIQKKDLARMHIKKEHNTTLYLLGD